MGRKRKSREAVRGKRRGGGEVPGGEDHNRMEVMNIMILTDHESKLLYDYYEPERMKNIDLIISCGDLSSDYLTFFATLCQVPVLYVRGNHDGQYAEKPPEGCICIEDDIFVYRGVRILGLGGSMEYIPGAVNQYTERQMRRRVRRLSFKLWRRRGFDILVAHAPAYQVNDLEDLPHRGFAVFRTLMEKYRPRFFFHGHVHANYSSNFKRRDTFGDTTVINAYDFYVVEYPMETL